MPQFVDGRVTPRMGRAWFVWATSCLAFAAVATAQVGPDLQLRSLSNRPDMVSGGDALIGVDLPSGIPPGSVRITLNGTDVTSRFRAGQGGPSLVGLVSGMREGTNGLAAVAGGRSAQLALRNHPISGPVLAGPHEQPFICETDSFKLRSGGTLGKPLDAHCSIATRVDYVYRPAAGGDLLPLADPSHPPSDVATTQTLLGRTVPYIVRIETGTVNRAVYQIAMLHDPAHEPAPDFITRSAGWNGRLIYTFGGGCTTGWFRQGNRTGGVEDDGMLRQGYAVASASLNVFGNNCAELIAIETMMMVKERFIEAYGRPLFTIGWGGSGGSYQQHQIADGYPGLLDGIMPARSFPDVAFGTVPFVTDAALLANYFGKATIAFTDEQKRQVSGFGLLTTMTNDGLDPGRIDPNAHCPEVLPAAQRYDAVGNPRGARCDVFDHAVNVYGRDPRTGFARRPLDNVGLQYGLIPLNAGVITKEQFLDLNERIGGYDADANLVPQRSTADLAAVRAAYRSGRLTSGGGGLAVTPIIDYRAYMDDIPAGNVHVRYHSFSTRDRLMKANGHADNHVMLTDDRKWGDNLGAPVLLDALRQMDAWLTALAQDTSNDSQIAKVRRAKPADLVDACWTRDDRPQKIVERQTYRSGRCEELYPANSFPRGQAGGPIAADTIKCQLKPVDAADYRVTFSAADMARLKRAFPDGVCDWSKPGLEQQPMAGTWQTFNPSGGAGTAASR